MTPNSDANTAIELLETLLKAKIRLQDAQAEASPVLESVGLLFEPEVLNEDQKNLLRNGLKSLRKLLEAHTAYSDAVQQAEPARAIVNQLLGGQPPHLDAANGKAEPPAEPDKAEPAKAEPAKAEPAKAEATKAEPAKPESTSKSAAAKGGDAKSAK